MRSSHIQHLSSRSNDRYLAPAVRFPVRRSMPLLCCLALWTVFALAVMLYVFWQLRGDSLSSGQVLGMVGLCCAQVVFALIALRQWARLPEGHLTWNRSQWLLHISQPHHFHQQDRPTVVLGAPEVALDLQWALLLKTPCVETYQKCWLWLEKQSAPLYWPDLRRAVYAH